MKSLLISFLFLCSLSAASAALTEHWVASNGTQTTWATCTGSTEPVSNSNRCTLSTAFTNATAGDLIHVKNDATYSRTTTSDTMTNAGTITSPIIFRGYSSTVNDGNLGRSPVNGDLVLTNMPVITYTTGKLTATGFVILESLNIASAVNGNTITLASAGSDIVKSCKVINSGTNANCTAITHAAGAGSMTVDCDVQLTGSAGIAAITCNNASGRIIGCRIKGGPAATAAINLLSSGAVINNVIFATTAAPAIFINSTTAGNTIYGNTIVGNSADAVNLITGITSIQCIMNNIITDNTGDAIDMTNSSNGAFLAYNRTRDNGSALANGGDWTTATTYAHVTTDTGGPETDYVDSTTNDYRLISTSPAVGAGYPPYMDIGAFQRQATAGGGGQRGWIGWIQFRTWLESGGLIKK